MRSQYRAGESHQGVLQGLQAWQIEVIRRFIEYEHIGTLLNQASQAQFTPLAQAQFGNGPARQMSITEHSTSMQEGQQIVVTVASDITEHIQDCFAPR